MFVKASLSRSNASRDCCSVGTIVLYRFINYNFTARYNNFSTAPALGCTIFFKIAHLSILMSNQTNKILKDFGKKLQKLRIEKGFSTRKFAYEADISPSSLGRLEAGLSNPSLTTLLKIAEALEVDLNTLTSAAK
jgi:DNA-binding XRE family transcriptional regulator